MTAASSGGTEVYRPTLSPMSTMDGTAGAARTMVMPCLNAWLDEPKLRARTRPPPSRRIWALHACSVVMHSRAAEPPSR